MDELVWPSREIFLAQSRGPAPLGNPHPVDSEWCRFAIRNNIYADQAREHYHINSPFWGTSQPIWSPRRIGQSVTRIEWDVEHQDQPLEIKIGGQYDDMPGPDNIGYNDVIVTHENGKIDHFTYPEADFPACSYHSATRIRRDSAFVENCIVIIGGRIWNDYAVGGVTPVHVLNLDTWAMTGIYVPGIEPDYLHNHCATYLHEYNGILVHRKNKIYGKSQFRNGVMWLLELDPWKWHKVKFSDL